MNAGSEKSRRDLFRTSQESNTHRDLALSVSVGIRNLLLHSLQCNDIIIECLRILFYQAIHPGNQL